MRKMMRQYFPYRLQFYLQLTLTYFISHILYKGKKSQKDFLDKNETKIHQFF